MDDAKKFNKNVLQSIIVLSALMLIVGSIFCGKVFAQAPQQKEAVQPALSMEKSDVMKFGFLGAAIAFGLGAIGAGMAISHVGAAAMGAIAEKPQIFGQALIFVALAEGLVVFGFITALLILAKV